MNLNPKKINAFALTMLFIANVSHSHQSDGNFKATHSDEISEVLRFADPNASKQLAVHNIYGHIEIKGHSGSEVRVEATRSLRALNPEVLQEAMAEVGLRFESLQNRCQAF